MTAFWRDGRWRPGAQLALAVALAWAAAAALHLPESFWAVMSVLIVMRPSAGSTLEAGWERVRSTAVGAVCGLAGVWLQHHGAHGPATTLAVVLALAFAGATVPGLRSAPVAALIVLSSGSLPGHSALQVALLRMVQIGIGVGVSLAVATFSAEYHAGARFNTGCAALLRGMARRIAALCDGDDAAPRRSDEEAERASAAVRASLARLAVLAGAADLEARWWRRGDARADDDAARRFRTRARIAARVFQDTVLLSRVFAHAKPQQRADDPLWHEAAQAASFTLAAMADALEGHAAPPALGTLRRLAECAPNAPSRALLAAPLRLLLADLHQLHSSIATPAPATA